MTSRFIPVAAVVAAMGGGWSVHTTAEHMKAEFRDAIVRLDLDVTRRIGAATAPDKDIAQRQEEMTNATVRLTAGFSTGSGTVIGRNRILTNHHVIDSVLRPDADPSVKIEGWVVKDGKTVPLTLTGKVVAYDAAADLAVVEIDGEGWPGPIARLAPSTADLRIGEVVFSVGAGDGIRPFLAAGLLSLINEPQPEFGDNRIWLIASAPITHGNSGGGLWHLAADGRYELIGVPSMGNPPIWHIGYSIPIDVVRAFLASAGLTS